VQIESANEVYFARHTLRSAPDVSPEVRINSARWNTVAGPYQVEILASFLIHEATHALESKIRANNNERRAGNRLETQSIELPRDIDLIENYYGTMFRRRLTAALINLKFIN